MGERVSRERIGNKCVPPDSWAHLVDDGGQDTLVKVGAEVAVDIGKAALLRPGEDTEADVDHLQVCCAKTGRVSVKGTVGV